LLNKHLQELMEGLTAKVFRTYNASRTLQEQLNLLTNRELTTFSVAMIKTHYAVMMSSQVLVLESGL
jgi:hypothetical protein